jgi:hypothetical protein
MKLIVAGANLLEGAGAVITVSGEDATKPKTRLYDRRTRLPFADTANTGTRVYKVDQGAGGTGATNALYIAAGHNLSGATVAYESSPDDAVWTPRGSIVPASSGAFRIHGAGLTPWTTRYTRMTVTGAAAAPQLTEALFTLALQYPFEVSEPGTRYGRRGNIAVSKGSSGDETGVKRGETQFWAEYATRDLDHTAAAGIATRTALEAFFDAIHGGARPFFLEDADGIIRWTRVREPEIAFSAVPVYRHDAMLDVVEAF